MTQFKIKTWWKYGIWIFQGNVICYVYSDDNLGFPTDTEDECELGHSGSSEHSQPPDENNIEINQGN